MQRTRFDFDVITGPATRPAPRPAPTPVSVPVPREEAAAGERKDGAAAGGG
jgi:hypothetical protein